ncbi:hypothetical protein BOX15_Mlig028158g1 [Macrostomum lignano]|uniref:LRRNT domain-containing protein n=1 Tax=Macrostomum lignano TaxID=282301 RepID=A0A267GHG5_9PLAT|nr:hypothetical protein BOX15_Mlig028158g1 [Macrostomum lignano]
MRCSCMNSGFWFRRLASLTVCCLLLAIRAASKPPCPAQAPCQCTDLRIKCVQRESESLNYLDRVPYFVPSNRETRWSYNFHELRVREHAMTQLTLQFHWGVLNVRRVEVTSSLVREIQPGAFQGLLGVESLNLSHNLLSSLGNEDLRDLPSLRELVLHNNLIKTVALGAFRHTAFIAKLYLSHNYITEVPPGIRQLTNLMNLYLQFNKISTIPDNAFHGLRKLIILDLGALQRDLVIQRRAFCGLTSPQSADSSVGVQDGGGLVALYLRGNILRQLDLCAIGQARSLRGLNLTATFFPCSCQTASFANRRDWSRWYGFSPRFVTFDRSLLHDCSPQCRPQPCVDACAEPSSSFDSPPFKTSDPAQEAESTWFDSTRLQVRGGEAGSNNEGKGAARLLLSATFAAAPPLLLRLSVQLLTSW